MTRFTSFLMLAVMALLIPLAGCAEKYPPTPGAATAPAPGLLESLRLDLQRIFSKPIAAVMADATATLQTIAAQLAAGKIDQISAKQRSQCPQNTLDLVGYIQQLIGAPIPNGAGILWLLDQLNGMSQQQLQSLQTQVKLTLNTCVALLKLPGLPISDILRDRHVG